VATALGLHHSDLLALHAIGAAGGQLSAGDLSAQLELTSGATTALIDRLERLGYVARERDPTDRRKVLLRATGESAAKLRGRYRGIDDRIRALLATRSATEKAAIARFLSELVSSARHEKE
jgi:DNA-binding MarR family transcriptional regulator